MTQRLDPCARVHQSPIRGLVALGAVTVLLLHLNDMDNYLYNFLTVPCFPLFLGYIICQFCTYTMPIRPLLFLVEKRALFRHFQKTFSQLIWKFLVALLTHRPQVNVEEPGLCCK